MLRFNIKLLSNLTKYPCIRPCIIYHNSYQQNVISSYRDINTKVLTPTEVNQANNVDSDNLVKLRNDPDTFGVGYIKEELDEGDFKEHEFLTNPPNRSKRLSTKQYSEIIKDLISKRKIKEAIDVIEVRMLKDDKVKPENFLFNLVIGACGRVGYTKKAFSLYNNMKKRGLAVTPGTYTALFNACSNSPWPEDGLSRAKHLHEIMIEKRYEPNDTNYNAMIKAYGRCGDLRSAFSLVDEMIAKGFVIKDDTLNFLLQACITDKEAGFRHALLVWRKLIDKNIIPSLYTYNLMLRCIRDCSLGDLEVTREVIGKILPETDKFLELDTGKIDQLEDVIKPNVIDLESSASDFLTYKHNNEAENQLTTDSQDKKLFCKTPINEIKENRPNLMAPTPHLGNIISLSEVKLPEDRLLLVGGANSFLKNMFDNNSTPDIKTFSLLMDCIPNSLATEKEMIATMNKWKVKPDLDFYNLLIKRRSMRCDYEAGLEVVDMMKKRNMKPNLVTFGVLALGCKNKEEGENLIEDMKMGNYRLNAEILGAMLQQACYHNNFTYVMLIMELCLKEEISPNKKFMEHLEKFRKKCKAISNEKHTSKYFMKGFEIFRMRFKAWLKQVKIEEEPHPWQQFRQPTETDTRHYKDKSVRFKARHQSLFRQKTSTKHLSNPSNDKFSRKPKRIAKD